MCQARSKNLHNTRYAQRDTIKLMMKLNEFEKLPLMGILRGVDAGCIEPLVETVICAGLKTLEVTMNTEGAANIIEKAKTVADGRIYVGAGTVLSAADLEKALGAGADFIVMPVCVDEVMRISVDKGIPVFPGAFTPNEVFNAWNAGAAMVKVFPSGSLGPRYIKDLKGPLDKVKLMAVGGVRPENIDSFFEAGVDAVAFGSSVFKEEWLRVCDFDAIGKLVAEYVKIVKKKIESKK